MYMLKASILRHLNMLNSVAKKQTSIGQVQNVSYCGLYLDNCMRLVLELCCRRRRSRFGTGRRKAKLVVPRGMSFTGPIHLCSLTRFVDHPVSQKQAVYVRTPKN